MDALVLNQTTRFADLEKRQPSPKSRPRHAKAITQALALQRIVFGAVSPDLKPSEIAGLARAWCDLNEERRKLAMQPLPRPIDTTKIVKRGRSRSASPAPAEPVEPIPAPKAA